MTDQVGTDARIARVLHRVAGRYRNGSRFTRHYVAGKLRRDPVHTDLLRLAQAEPFGTVVDLGCGRGQVGMALLEADGARSVLGLDVDAARVAEAQRAGTGLAFQARRVDLSVSLSLPECDTVLLIDVLYQLPTSAQDSVLDAVARAARKRVLIRTMDPSRGVRSLVARTMERWLRRVLPNTGATVNPLPIAAIIGRLSSFGFECSVQPCWRGTPLPNVLLIARR